ncbi:MAG TPA: glycosyltransferase family 4 protein [Pedobacter sp.]|uniref:glycosyltransferase family 4 protein n=1 Tax=Pedobacter sp. TaxID=1411316 RepID=UPI002C38B946|nr:glycosyltransferase family 4 protein [Pedobacter sp.]HMI00868.1 glycosyltransferase family 4 protein [Pedobacter sp.]
MKVAFLISDSSLERGGERATITLANSFAAGNYEVNLLSLYQKNKPGFFEVDKRIQVHIAIKGSQSKSKWLFQKLKEMIFVFGQLRRIDIDVFIGVGTYCSVLLGFFKWLNSKKKYVAWEHSNYFAVSPAWDRLRKVYYQKLNAIVCLNQTDLKIYLQEFKNVYQIPNMIGFKTEDKATRERKIILSIGALEEEKGFDLLIRAFHTVKHLDDWNLLIVGAGSKKTELLRLAAQLEMRDRVIIKDNTKAIIREYLNASIYVLPSRREGFGMVLIEAMECGLPCIAFDCPTGPANIITHYQNGLLVPALDYRALGQMMALLVSEGDLARKLSNAGLTTVEQYSESKVLSFWKILLNDLYQ